MVTDYYDHWQPISLDLFTRQWESDSNIKLWHETQVYSLFLTKVNSFWSGTISLYIELLHKRRYSIWFIHELSWIHIKIGPKTYFVDWFEYWLISGLITYKIVDTHWLDTFIIMIFTTYLDLRHKRLARTRFISSSKKLICSSSLLSIGTWYRFLIGWESIV